jgi:hypothetical protein
MWVIKNKMDKTLEHPDSINRSVSKAAILFSVAAVLLTHKDWRTRKRLHTKSDGTSCAWP